MLSNITDDNFFFQEDSAQVHCVTQSNRVKMWFSRFPVLPGSAEAQATQGDIVKRLLIAYFIRNYFCQKISKSIHVCRQQGAFFEIRCYTFSGGFYGILPGAKLTLRPRLALSNIDSVIAWQSSRRQPNFAALSAGRHLYSAGRPSCWALAHILVLPASLSMASEKERKKGPGSRPRFVSNRIPIFVNPVQCTNYKHIDMAYSSLPALHSSPSSVPTFVSRKSNMWEWMSRAATDSNLLIEYITAYSTEHTHSVISRNDDFTHSIRPTTPVTLKRWLSIAMTT